MNKEVAALRCKYLSETTGLPVVSYSRNGVEYFQFGDANRTIITVPTYRKARCFAQGFSYGREYERLLHVRPSLLSKLLATIKARLPWRKS
jgi:hypothetical protein